MAHAAIHPLVLLTISDYITRHTLRNLKQPIVGVLLGQQNGREVTIEHAYDVRLIPADQAENDPTGSTWKLHEAFFRDRLQQYKDVHKNPPLELMGWWTLSPSSDLPQDMMGIHQYVMENYNESALLLAFHPETVKQSEASSGSAPGVKLPLTIYESVYESSKADADPDKMQIEGAAPSGELLQLRLREMPYEIATGEAEMIAVDFVARGGGNATAIDDKFATVHASKMQSTREKDDLNGSVAGEKKRSDNQSSYLNPEEEELLAFLTTRANAIKMLQSRISLLKNRLVALPPSYLTSKDAVTTQAKDSSSNEAPPYQLLRAIQALTAKLSLVAAFDPPQLANESTAIRADAALVDLLATLGTSARDARQLGGRFAAREQTRRSGAPFERGGIPAPEVMFPDGELPSFGALTRARAMAGEGVGRQNAEQGGSWMEF